jgi:hypothetical protein
MDGVQEDRIALLLYLSFPVHLINKHLGVFVPYLLFDSLCHFHSFCNLLLSHSLVFNNEGCHGFPGIRHCPLREYCYR